MSSSGFARSARSVCTASCAQRALSLIFNATLLAVAVPAFAQATDGRLTGIVFDEQRAAISGASVNVTCASTTKHVITNAKGEFLLRFRPSAPGNYTVTATVTPPGQGPISTTTTFTVERPRPRRGWSLTSGSGPGGASTRAASARARRAVRVASRR